MANTLSDVLNAFSNSKFMVGCGVVVSGAVVWVGFKFLSNKRNVKKVRVCGVDYPKDKVIVHCPKSEGKFVPSDSPFTMKLETYLRVAKIPYEACFDLDLSDSPKGKIPWIEYNGTVMGDSQFIIKYLNKEYNVDLNKSLSPYQRAMAWGIQKWLEEHTYWLNARIRWVIFSEDYHSGKYMSQYYSQPKVKKFIKALMTNMTCLQGVGRHSNDDVFEMIGFDLRQLSLLLGTNKYICGEKITEVDCFAFGILCQIRYQTPDDCPGKQLLNGTKDMKNLRDYIDRIKFQCWPDWEERLLNE